MIISIRRLRCGACHKLVKYKDQVYLDILNTVVHMRCYSINYEIKDKGTLNEVVSRHDFLDEFMRNSY